MWARLAGRIFAATRRDTSDRHLTLSDADRVVYAIGDVHGCFDQLLQLESLVVEDARRYGDRAKTIVLRASYSGAPAQLFSNRPRRKPRSVDAGFSRPSRRKAELAVDRRPRNPRLVSRAGSHWGHDPAEIEEVGEERAGFHSRRSPRVYAQSAAQRRVG
jgi:hypothetical protein